MKQLLIPVFLLGVATFISLSVTESLLDLKESSAEFRGGIDESPQSGFLKINGFDISGTNYLTSEQVQKELSPFIGLSVFKVSERDILTQVLRNPWVRQAEVDLGYLTGEVEVSITEEEPAYTVESSGLLWVVSNDGALLSPLSLVTNQSLLDAVSLLPKIISDSEEVFTVGISSLVSFNIKKSVPFEIEEVQLKERWLVLVPYDFESFPRVLVPYQSDGNYEKHVNNLSALLPQLKKEGLKAGEVDLRFEDKAIVRKTSAI